MCSSFSANPPRKMNIGTSNTVQAPPKDESYEIPVENFGAHQEPTPKKTIAHMAIEGVLTRQKCAETPYATFWSPSLKDLAPQKAITSLFKFSNFLRHTIPPKLVSDPSILSPETPAHIFRSFLKDARREMIENGLFKS